MAAAAVDVAGAAWRLKSLIEDEKENVEKLVPNLTSRVLRLHSLLTLGDELDLVSSDVADALGSMLAESSEVVKAFSEKKGTGRIWRFLRSGNWKEVFLSMGNQITAAANELAAKVGMLSHQTLQNAIGDLPQTVVDKLKLALKEGLGASMGSQGDLEARLERLEKGGVQEESGRMMASLKELSVKVRWCAVVLCVSLPCLLSFSPPCTSLLLPSCCSTASPSTLCFLAPLCAC